MAFILKAFRFTIKLTNDGKGTVVSLRAVLMTRWLKAVLVHHTSYLASVSASAFVLVVSYHISAAFLGATQFSDYPREHLNVLAACDRIQTNDASSSPQYCFDLLCSNRNIAYINIVVYGL